MKCLVRAVFAIFAVFVASGTVVAAPRQNFVGVWLLDPVATERYFLEDPQLANIEWGWSFGAVLACNTVLTVTADALVWTTRAGQSLRSMRKAQSAVEDHTFEESSTGVKPWKLKPVGSYITIVDSGGWENLLWRRVSELPPTRKLSEREERECYEPLERVYQRYKR